MLCSLNLILPSNASDTFCLTAFTLILLESRVMWRLSANVLQIHRSVQLLLQAAVL